MRVLFLILMVPYFAQGEALPREDKSGIYSPAGKRDPFKLPTQDAMSRNPANLAPAQKYSIDKLPLRAVLRSEGQAQAMFEDPDGNTYIVVEGDILGRERCTVSRILENEVIVTERTFNYLGAEVLFERVLSLPKEEIFKTNPIPKAPDRAPSKEPEPVIPPPAMPAIPQPAQDSAPAPAPAAPSEPADPYVKDL